MERERINRILREKIRFKFPYDIDDWIENLYMENYHYHTDFSNNETPDSAENQMNYLKKTKEYGQKCLYSGEHGSQGNQFETYKICEANGMKYRHSAEAYWVKDRHEKDRKNCHIMLIAKNDEGRRDMNYILSMANIDGYYFRPRIDLELLLNVPSENMIVTTACLAGWFYDDAEDIWLKIAEHFGDNFFCELQYHLTDKQKEINKKILKFAKKHNLQLIAGLDSHWTSEEREDMRSQILKFRKVEFNDNEKGWFMDYPSTQVVIDRFKEQGVLTEDEILEAVLNTNVFVNECEEIVFDRSFKIPNIYSDLDYDGRVKKLKHIINEEYKKDPNKSKEKKEGIKWEVQQFIDSNTVDYPLMSKAIVDKAVGDYNAVLTKTARGSASSFFTSNLMHLTTVDRFNADIPLYPERFLTKDRILAGSMPDIDLNCESQEPFVKAVRSLLGEHGCYPLMTLLKLKEKAAWQLYAGANDVPPAKSLEISKAISKYDDKLKYTDEEDKDSIHIEDFIPGEYLDLYKESLIYQGVTNKCGMHACAKLVFDGDIRREIGLISAKNETTGSRELVAAVEGQYLDEFGYVKEDFLIVDVVGLINEFWMSINEPVPSFEELKKLVKDDPKTWEIYEKGVTCCINQCEKTATTNKLMKYKPRNIAELSAFIAGIRPGFKSLIDNFLKRAPYTTGEEKIDELLNDSAHYMIYQESIMKVLSFLGMPMSETYGIIKAISKKKLKGQKKDKLLIDLRRSWKEIFGNLDNFDSIWKVIEDSAAYSFNASHAYSMAGDSLYCAYFKAHYPAKFYEVAIRHYQKKNKKDKIQDLLDEALKFYGFRYADYEFGQDNRQANIDETTKMIYPNLSSIKGFGEQVAETFWELSQNKDYENFVDILIDLKGSKISKTIVHNLICIDYFKKFGTAKKLLKIHKIYLLLKNGEGKEISLKKAEEEKIDINDLEKFGHRTAKKINKINTLAYLHHVEEITPNEKPDLPFIIKNQKEIMGLFKYIDENTPDTIYGVNKLSVKKLVIAELYSIKTGDIVTVKLWKSDYEKQVFDEGDTLNVPILQSKNKQERGEWNEKKNKYDYVPIPNEYEFWMNKWTIIKEKSC